MTKSSNNIFFSVYTSEIDETEKEKFVKKHKHRVKEQGAIGVSNFSYIVSFTSLGKAIAIKCEKCGEEKYITNVDVW